MQNIKSFRRGLWGTLWPPSPANRKIKTSSKNAFWFMHMCEESIHFWNYNLPKTHLQHYSCAVPIVTPTAFSQKTHFCRKQKIFLRRLSRQLGTTFWASCLHFWGSYHHFLRLLQWEQAIRTSWGHDFLRGKLIHQKGVSHLGIHEPKSQQPPTPGTVLIQTGPYRTSQLKV